MVKILFISIMIILSILPYPVISSDTGTLIIEGNVGEEYTGGWINGRYWEELNLQNKILLLEGINYGIFFMTNELLGSAINSDGKKIVTSKTDYIITSGFKVSEFVKEIDKFYSDKTVIKVPVPYAYVYILKKFRGEDAKLVEDYRNQLLKQWNTIKPN